MEFDGKEVQKSNEKMIVKKIVKVEMMNSVVKELKVLEIRAPTGRKRTNGSRRK